MQSESKRLFDPDIPQQCLLRPIDELGRIVIPKELRRTLGINESDPVEILLDDESQKIILKAYTGNACIFCGDMDAIRFKDKFVCRSCIHTATEQATLVEGNQSGATTSKTDLNIKELKKDNGNSKIQLLLEEITKDPKARRVELAKRFGVTPAYANVLMKKINERNLLASIHEAASDKN